MTFCFDTHVKINANWLSGFVVVFFVSTVTRRKFAMVLTTVSTSSAQYTHLKVILNLLASHILLVFIENDSKYQCKIKSNTKIEWYNRDRGRQWGSEREREKESARTPRGKERTIESDKVMPCVVVGIWVYLKIDETANKKKEKKYSLKSNFAIQPIEMVSRFGCI